MRIPLIGLAVTVVAGISCSKVTVPCAGIGLARIDPSDTTISVGQSFVARYYEGGMCVGDEDSRHLELLPIASWYSLDTTIVTVDSTTGRVTGRATGNGRVSARERGFVVSVRV